VFAHLLLHAGFGHLDPRTALPSDLGPNMPRKWRTYARRVPGYPYQAACCAVVDRFLVTLKLGRSPEPLPRLPEEIATLDERALADRWRATGVPTAFDVPKFSDFLVGDEKTAKDEDFPKQLAAGISSAALTALEVAGGARPGLSDGMPKPWNVALGWFVSSYPLLGALAAGMTVIADAELARSWQVEVAAVSAQAAEIYINPMAALAEDEWRFVLAHEMLHAALRHGDRTSWRDPYLFNIATDYVVNGWLMEMGVGTMPEGLLYDQELKGLSAETVYDRIVTDLRRMRRLRTLRGRGLGDVLDQPLTPIRDYVDLDEYYRRCMLAGLAYHESARGYLPAGLVEAVRALEQPPLSWDAELARWFEEHVPAIERRRSYGRASRRQSATPDIPRPGWVRPEELVRQVTFGVVLDTSGSMDTRLLGKALGAIASYAMARDVPRARVVFCDARAYDAGYLPVEEIAGKVRVRGRGGTILQPGINMLERAADFPADGPILVITDGYCDALRIRREHAFLIPAGASLPFRPRGPVFHMK
jgi:predicted metal-dependent peptidase